VAGHRFSRESRSRADDRSCCNHVIGAKFMLLFFTFKKYSEFLASLVICFQKTVGLWRMDFEHSSW
jgi:hypothetical protein